MGPGKPILFILLYSSGPCYSSSKWIFLPKIAFAGMAIPGIKNPKSSLFSEIYPTFFTSFTFCLEFLSGENSRSSSYREGDIIAQKKYSSKPDR
jgi:hypothetical protein